MEFCPHNVTSLYFEKEARRIQKNNVFFTDQRSNEAALNFALWLNRLSQIVARYKSKSNWELTRNVYCTIGHPCDLQARDSDFPDAIDQLRRDGQVLLESTCRKNR